MLSFTHELLVELFRNGGQLAVELLRQCAGIPLEHARVAVGSIDLSQVAPTEYRADAVIVLHGRDDRPDQSRLYLDVIMAALPAALRHILEARMQGYEYQSDFARKYYGQGRREGLREALIVLARGRLGQLSDDELAAIEAVADEAGLTALIRSIGGAITASDARAILRGAPTR